jgi:hypothetical protein
MPAISGLTYSDKKTILAGALAVREWNIDDISDTEVYYTNDIETGVGTNTVRGTFKRTYTITQGIDSKTQVKLGEPTRVIKRTVYEPLVVVGAFSLDDTAEFTGDTVTISGKGFECGDYPDKGFSLTEEEADQAITAFSPVPNDLEHRPTPLDGKLGTLQSISRNGKDILAKCQLPKWLYDALPKPVKVSFAWDKATKRVVGNALVLNPRIPDAQLMAAFSAANNPIPEGGTIMKVKEAIDRLKAFFGKSGMPDELKDIDLDKVDFSADPEPAAPPATPPATDPKPEPAPAAVFTLSGTDTRLLALEAERFIDAQIKAGKVYPAEKESLMALFVQSAKDDAMESKVACFAGDGTLTEGRRLKALKAGVEARPAHQLMDETIPGALLPAEVVAFAKDENTPTPKGQSPSTARMNKLRALQGLETKEGK